MLKKNKIVIILLLTNLIHSIINKYKKTKAHIEKYDNATTMLIKKGVPIY